VIWIKAARRRQATIAGVEWQPIATAPFDCALELAVIDRKGAHALVFACRRVADGWANAETGRLIDVPATHWRKWPDNGPARD
jgi:hypothetical protein